MSCKEDKDKNKVKNASNNNNNVVLPPIIISNGNSGDAATQGIRFVFAQNPTAIGTSGDLPTLITTVPFQTNVGDRVKLDAMFQINVSTNGSGILALRSTTVEIQRSTTLLGQDTPMNESIVAVTVQDDELNNPPSINSYTRLVTLTWVDTPPAGITSYSLRAVALSNGEIANVTFSNRALNAIIFPVGSSLS